MARAWTPDVRDRHLVSRFSFGWNESIEQQVRPKGAHAWFRRQLHPRHLPDRHAASMRSWFPVLDEPADRLWRRYRAGTLSVQETADDLARWTLLRRMHSVRQVAEVMADFWSNLLYVPAPNDKSWMFRSAYDARLRRHALGRFDEMLTAAVLHPAMLAYLDNAVSTKDEPNENLGREILELFTVGTSYRERDVWNAAMILTGWTVDCERTWKRRYRASDHYVGRVRVLGFEARNAHSDGTKLTRRFLHYLAHHPATAHRIALRLAVRFVCDDPPKKLVARVAKAYRRHDTDVRATLRALVDDPAFDRDAYVGAKVRTPVEDYVASARALGVRARMPTGQDTDLAALCVWQALSMGQRPFGWPRPDGFPDKAQVWTNATRMLGSWQLHQTLASGTRPSTAVRYRDHAAYLPDLPLPFADFVSEVAARLLYRRVNARVVQAAAEATGSAPGDVVTSQHRAIRSSFPLLLTALLDSTEHMTR